MRTFTTGAFEKMSPRGPNTGWLRAKGSGMRSRAARRRSPELSDPQLSPWRPRRRVRDGSTSSSALVSDPEFLPQPAEIVVAHRIGGGLLRRVVLQDLEPGDDPLSALRAFGGGPGRGVAKRRDRLVEHPPIVISEVLVDNRTLLLREQSARWLNPTLAIGRGHHLLDRLALDQ